MAEVKVSCPCPPKSDGTVRHPDGDTVYFRAVLGWQAFATAKNTVGLARADDPETSAAEMLAGISEVYVLHGVEDWTLTDNRGKPLEVTRTAIREMLLADPERAMDVVEAADVQYREVMLPLLVRVSNSSPPTPTDGSMSATNGSPPAPRKRQKPSSTTTSQTDGIAPIAALHAGASS